MAYKDVIKTHVNEEEIKLQILKDIFANYNMRVPVNYWKWDSLHDLIFSLQITNDSLIVDLASRYEELF